MKLPPYVVLEKSVGETPLSCMEAYRAQHPELIGVPLAYAGRLDPLASGKLLMLVGDECKRQKEYHGLDKEYIIEVVFGISSDTGDVMGLLTPVDAPPSIANNTLHALTRELSHTELTFPYPAFSSKTVSGKPLHTWTCEGRLAEVIIPTYTAPLYELTLTHTTTLSGAELAERSRTKIDSLPSVTDLRKALGNDFRREPIRKDWQTFKDAHTHDIYTVATFRVRTGSGMYMRTLANEIAKRVGTRGLCLSIHRSKIGTLHTIFGHTFFIQKQTTW